MKVNEWHVELTSNELVITNNAVTKSYPLYVYLNNNQYEIFKIYEGVRSADILLGLFKQSFSDFHNSNAVNFLNKLIKPKVYFKYPRSIREQFVDFERIIFREVIEQAGAREVKLSVA